MKFNNALHAALCSVIIFSLLACTSQSTRERSQTARSELILPAGPVIPNPYLQSKPKLSPDVEAQFHTAVAAMQLKQWAQAETILHSLSSDHPQLSGVLLNLGIVYRARGDAHSATEAFTRAINANPKNIEAYNQLAVLKREAGEFNEAEVLYQQALSVWPFHPDSHKNIAILYELYMGKPEQALPHYLAYQQLLETPDKQVASWIADLQRRLNTGKKDSSSVGQIADPAIEKKDNQ